MGHSGLLTVMFRRQLCTIWLPVLKSLANGKIFWICDIVARLACKPVGLPIENALSTKNA